MNCEMCGKEAQLYKAQIEGTVMSVCPDCAKFGKILSYPKAPVKEEKKKQAQFIPQKPKEPEVIDTIVSNYADIIKKKREYMGLKQEELAKMVAEKESLLHNIESGHFEPPMELARKFEKYLHIRLIEQATDEKPFLGKLKHNELTLGDMAKIKKR